VLVIALFYTDQLLLNWLGGALAVVGAMLTLNLAGVRRTAPYFVLAVVLWYLLLESGVHATLAGVLGAFTVPARPRYDPAVFSRRVKVLIARLDASHSPGESILTNDESRSLIQALGNGARDVQAPLQRLEHQWNLPVAFLVVPVFALFNAGVPLNFGDLRETLNHPVTVGVTAGLVIGKFVGITVVVWSALKLGVGQLPSGTRLSQIAGVSLLAGIGFTMSIFIAELGFSGQPEQLLMAKTGVLLASVIAGIGGFVWLYLYAGSVASSVPSQPRD
jgi:NhaA family Na+:H+ antiporter